MRLNIKLRVRYWLYFIVSSDWLASTLLFNHKPCWKIAFSWFSDHTKMIYFHNQKQFFNWPSCRHSTGAYLQISMPSGHGISKWWRFPCCEGVEARLVSDRFGDTGMWTNENQKTSFSGIKFHVLHLIFVIRIFIAQTASWYWNGTLVIALYSIELELDIVYFIKPHFMFIYVYEEEPTYFTIVGDRSKM